MVFAGRVTGEPKHSRASPARAMPEYAFGLHLHASAMNRNEIDAAARFLLAARQSRTPGERLPVDLRPPDLTDALAIQARTSELLGLAIGGYKCSAPTDARPVSYAPIHAPTILDASPYPVPGAGAQARIEPEIALVMGHDLPPRATPYSDDEVRSAVKEARLVLEIIGSRYAEPSAVTFPELLADNVANLGLYVGPVLPDPWSKDLDAFPIAVRTGAATLMTRDGKHPDGHPLRALAWLANYLASRGEVLKAGLVVTTGSYCGILEVPVDTPLTFAYGDLGTLAVSLTKG